MVKYIKEIKIDKEQLNAINDLIFDELYIKNFEENIKFYIEKIDFFIDKKLAYYCIAFFRSDLILSILPPT